MAAQQGVRDVLQADDFSVSQKSELAERVAASRPFSKSPQLRGFLLFVVDRALTDRLADINEHEIGRTVFGRRANFNPHEDTIVRVQARRLRAKLDEYFGGPGKEESLVVTIPKGSYVPRFEARAAVEPEPWTPEPEEPLPVVPEPTTPSLRRGSLWMILALCGVFVAGFAIAALWRSSARTAAPHFRNPILARLFSSSSPKIALSDSSVVSLQRIIRRRISVDEYLQPDYPHALTGAIHDAEFRIWIERITRSQLTNYSDSNTVSQLVLLGQRYGMPVVLRHPRQMNRNDFETDSVVLLGGHFANPWYGLFEPRLNFVFDADPVSEEFFVRNRNPHEGEAKEYRATTVRQGEETFAVVSLLPNLKNTGYVLLLAGIDVHGTEGAINGVMRDDLPEALLAVFRDAEQQGGYCEMLLKVRSIGGIPRETTVVASRIIPGKAPQ